MKFNELQNLGKQNFGTFFLFLIYFAIFNCFLTLHLFQTVQTFKITLKQDGPDGIKLCIASCIFRIVLIQSYLSESNTADNPLDSAYLKTGRKS